MSEHFEPKGIRFYSQNQKREMLLCEEGDFEGWICYRHPDGQWVSLRKATKDDLKFLAGYCKSCSNYEYEHTTAFWEAAKWHKAEKRVRARLATAKAEDEGVEA